MQVKFQLVPPELRVKCSHYIDLFHCLDLILRGRQI
jgi:hypothetical protein